MRVTTNMMTVNYTYMLNNSKEELYRCNTQVATGRSFMKASQDPSAAMEAYDVREQLAELESYGYTINDVYAKYEIAETTLSTLTDVVKAAQDVVMQVMNGTTDPESLEIFASNLEIMQQEILSVMNAKIGDEYIFGGADSEDPPFSLDPTTGELCYKGIPVDSGTAADFPNEDAFVDIGLGIQYDANGDVIPSTAFDSAINGIEILGYGTDANGMPNNLYSLLGDIAADIRAGDLSNMEAYMTKLEECEDKIITAYSHLGNQMAFLEFQGAQLQSQAEVLLGVQADLEYTDPVQAIMMYQAQEVAYQACLAMGPAIFQPTLLDYVM